MTTWAFPCYLRDWPKLIDELSKAEPHLRSIGRPEAADLLLRAYRELRDSVEHLNVSSAQSGTLVLRRIEKETRVRPDAGAHGSLHGDLNAALFVRKLPDIPGIGIVDLDLLDTDVPWWRTNEFGSSANIGRTIYGSFYGAADAGPPDPNRFREHPLFQPGNSSGVAGLGIIERPIPARHFIQKSIKAIDGKWRADWDKMYARFLLRMDLVTKTMT